jgi:hypothetical protein
VLGRDESRQQELSVSEQWLEARAPGFRDLPSADRRAIFDFAFLWSLFEAQITKNFARADRIREKVDEWAVEGTLEAGLYDAELAYFRKRYFAGGQLTYHFPFLELRPSDNPELVKAPWAYELRDQLTNFTHANQVLMRLLERLGRLGLP